MQAQQNNYSLIPLLELTLENLVLDQKLGELLVLSKKLAEKAALTSDHVSCFGVVNLTERQESRLEVINRNMRAVETFLTEIEENATGDYSEE